MEHEIRHDLDVANAQRVARQALESYRERFAAYQPEVKWPNENEAQIAFTVKGMRLTGGLAIEPTRFRLRLDVPFLFRPFKGRAMSVIEREVQGWLQRAKAEA